MRYQVTFFDLHTPILEGVTIRIYKIPCIYYLSSLQVSQVVIKLLITKCSMIYKRLIQTIQRNHFVHQVVNSIIRWLSTIKNIDSIQDYQIELNFLKLNKIEIFNLQREVNVRNKTTEAFSLSTRPSISVFQTI